MNIALVHYGALFPFLAFQLIHLVVAGPPFMQIRLNPLLSSLSNAKLSIFYLILALALFTVFITTSEIFI